MIGLQNPKSQIQNRLAGWSRGLVLPPESAVRGLSGGATVNAQFWLGQHFWRPTAAWAALAAMLAVGAFGNVQTVDWREVALLLLLVDPLWGSLWRLAGGRDSMLPLHEHEVRRDVWLPYLQPKSPASMLLGLDDHGVLHLVYRVVLPTAVLALAIAYVLGPVAVGMSVVVLIASGLGWIGRHTAGRPAVVLGSLVAIGLPWWLALNLFGPQQGEAGWWSVAALAGLWTLHHWGESRVMVRAGDGLGIALLGAAEVGIAALLLITRTPLWLAVLAALWLPTWLSIVQGRPMPRLQIWWLLAMLVSGLALGQGL